MMMWNRYYIKRIILDFSLKVTKQPFHGSIAVYQKEGADWKDDIGLDSIEIMQLAAHVNSFFALFEMNDPPYLLSFTKVDDWVEQVYDAKQKVDDCLSFYSSGTSGQAKVTRHRTNFLQREVEWLASHFKNITQIIPYVPSYTIYGFLFTVCLPHQLNIPLLYPSETDWQTISPNTLIVATPFHWQLLSESLPNKTPFCYGVSAAAPLYNGLFENLIQKNIKLTEIYGATETGGVGYRENPQQPFSLFPYWELIEENEGPILNDKEDRQLYQLMDNIRLINNRQFTLSGRKDKQVNIAGILVNPEEVRSVILQITGIQECRISAKAMDGEIVLQASIILDIDSEAERTRIKNQIRELLAAHERPGIVYFEPAVKPL
jgi:long-chain acyl-CoA synthetase